MVSQGTRRKENLSQAKMKQRHSNTLKAQRPKQRKASQARLHAMPLAMCPASRPSILPVGHTPINGNVPCHKARRTTNRLCRLPLRHNNKPSVTTACHVSCQLAMCYSYRSLLCQKAMCHAKATHTITLLSCRFAVGFGCYSIQGYTLTSSLLSYPKSMDCQIMFAEEPLHIHGTFAAF